MEKRLEVSKELIELSQKKEKEGKVMSKITGKTQIHESSKKWGYIVFFDSGKIIFESEYDFKNEEEAQEKLNSVFSQYLEDATLGRINEYR